MGAISVMGSGKPLCGPGAVGRRVGWGGDLAARRWSAATVPSRSAYARALEPASANAPALKAAHRSSNVRSSSSATLPCVDRSAHCRQQGGRGNTARGDWLCGQSFKSSVYTHLRSVDGDRLFDAWPASRARALPPPPARAARWRIARAFCLNRRELDEDRVRRRSAGSIGGARRERIFCMLNCSAAASASAAFCRMTADRHCSPAANASRRRVTSVSSCTPKVRSGPRSRRRAARVERWASRCLSRCHCVSRRAWPPPLEPAFP